MKKILMAVVAVALVAMTGAARAADTTVAVSATVVGTCIFTAGGAIPFGNLDPSDGTDQTPAVTQPTFWCTRGASYTITDDDGLYESAGAHQMKHASLTEYIPYSFTYTATGTGTGPGSPFTMNIASTVLGTDYRNASAGTYSDTVTLTITP